MDILKYNYFRESLGDNNDEFGFNDPSTHEGHLHQKGILTWFSIERAVKIKSRLNENFIKPPYPIATDKRGYPHIFLISP